MTKRLLGLMSVAMLVVVPSAFAGRGARVERRGERIENRGERQENRGERLQNRGHRLENRGQRHGAVAP